MKSDFVGLTTQFPEWIGLQIGAQLFQAYAGVWCFGIGLVYEIEMNQVRYDHMTET